MHLIHMNTARLTHMNTACLTQMSTACLTHMSTAHLTHMNTIYLTNEHHTSCTHEHHTSYTWAPHVLHTWTPHNLHTWALHIFLTQVNSTHIQISTAHLVWGITGLFFPPSSLKHPQFFVLVFSRPTQAGLLPRDLIISPCLIPPIYTQCHILSRRKHWFLNNAHMILLYLFLQTLGAHEV